MSSRSAIWSARSRSCGASFRACAFRPGTATAPQGFEGDDFINLVARVRHAICRCSELLKRLHRIEELCGRPRAAPRWAPRTMDLDILLYGELICDEPQLKLPRPDLLKRAYMLGPLADLAPELMHPTRKKTIRRAVAALSTGQRIRSCRSARRERVYQPTLRPPSTARICPVT